MQRLQETAELFNLPPSEYAKAVLYRDLGVFTEPLDQRRRMWKRKRRAEEAERTVFDEEPEDELTAGRGRSNIHGDR